MLDTGERENIGRERLSVMCQWTPSGSHTHIIRVLCDPLRSSKVHHLPPFSLCDVRGHGLLKRVWHLHAHLLTIQSITDALLCVQACTYTLNLNGTLQTHSHSPNKNKSRRRGPHALTPVSSYVCKYTVAPKRIWILKNEGQYIKQFNIGVSGIFFKDR